MAGSSSDSEPSWAERLGSLARVGSSLLSATGKAASNIISIKTKEDLAARPDQQALALDRHHRNLREDAKVLEAAMVRKRSELEECSIRCEEIRDALARREAFLADPGPRHALKARHKAAAALYATLAAEQDAAEAARQRTSAPRHEWFDEDDDALDAQPQQREEDDATTSAAESGGSSSGARRILAHECEVLAQLALARARGHVAARLHWHRPVPGLPLQAQGEQQGMEQAVRGAPGHGPCLL